MSRHLALLGASATASFASLAARFRSPADFEQEEGGALEQGGARVAECGALERLRCLGGATLDRGVPGALDVRLPQIARGAAFELGEITRELPIVRNQRGRDRARHWPLTADLDDLRLPWARFK